MHPQDPEIDEYIRRWYDIVDTKCLAIALKDRFPKLEAWSTAEVVFYIADRGPRPTGS